MHYSLAADSFSITNLPFLFLGTIFSYNLLQGGKVNKYLFSLTAISTILIPIDMLVQYLLISLITIAYPKYLRTNYILKPIAIATSWCLLFRSTSPTLYIEAFFFIVALSLPFDLRDKKEDTDIKTLAHILNPFTFKVICIIFWVIFIAIKVYFGPTELLSNLVIGLTIYYLLTLYFVKENSTRVTTYIFTDSTIALQYFLTYLIQTKGP